MLSKVSTLILGIIEERPVNPYEINKFLDIIKIKNWFPVAASSVYSTIKTLDKKEYIVGKHVKEGNMPEKTVYSITDKGREILNQTIAKLLSSKELDAAAFNIGTIFMCHLDKEYALEMLTSRIKKIEKELKAINDNYNYFLNTAGVPDYALISLKHNTYLFEAEHKTTLELIYKIKEDHSWSHFLAGNGE